CDNYLDAVDRAAEHFARSRPDLRPLDRAIAALAERGIEVVLAELGSGPVYLRDGKRITLNAAAEPATQAFQLLHLLALETRADLLEATLELA
ncbi:Cro/Cl family transcriptional regulator, partial [Paracoccus sp. PXZ]